MQQYLLNASAIWMLSLIIFDVLLRSENYHAYNRFYLLFTLLLGAVLPLVQWQDSGAIYPAALQRPIAAVTTVKQNIVSATTPAHTLSWEQWLGIMYLSGALIAILLLVADIVKLMIFYSKGNKHTDGDWTIVKTSKGHAPFSFRRILFVNAVEQYSAEEWNMICAHEERHTSLLHFADLLLIHIARVVFWFHPLVYIYRKRLLLVHEYQADNAAATQPQEYGKFLIEQAILGAAPSISHSFNRSPIKNRILMLTHKSTVTAKGKVLVIFPLCMLTIACFTKNSNAQQFIRNGNMVTYRGNRFTMSESKIDTYIVVDPVTGKEFTQLLQTGPDPIAINGNKIYNGVGTPPRYNAGNSTLEEIVFKNTAGVLNALPDGDYGMRITNVVIDEKGKVAYYDFSGVEQRLSINTWKLVTGDIQTQILAIVDKSLADAPALTPGSVNGTIVPARLMTEFYYINITVKDQKATISKG